MIFVHSSFRTSSTYVWSEFRKAENTTAYCEFYNESLSALTDETIGGAKPDAWYSKHPAGEPYFLEFGPLIKSGAGVEGFKTWMSYDAFVPATGLGGAITSDEIDYISLLIDNAGSKGKVPVLTDTRSLGRIAGLKEAFPGLHTFLYRNLFQQWCSITEQEFRGNKFFADAIDHIIRQNQHDAFLRQLAQQFPAPKATTLDKNFFYAFLGLHLYLYKNAAEHADLIIDINEAAANGEYRAAIESAIAGNSVKIDLSEVRNIISYSLCDLGSRLDVQRNIDWIRQRLGEDGPDGSSFLEKAIAELLTEYEASEHYTRFMRGALLHEARARGSNG